MKKKLVSILLASTMAVSLAACSATTSSSTGTSGGTGAASGEAAGGTEAGSSGGAAASGSAGLLDNGRFPKVTVAAGADVLDLEPDKVNEDPKYNFIYDIYETLFDMADDSSGEVKPCIASGYEVIDDTTWLVTMNDDVYDWEGNNITANDVEFCFNWLIDSGNALRADYFESLEVIDDYSFYFHWTEPLPAVSDVEFPLARFQIFSQKAYEEKGSFASDPVGTGCYTVSEYTPGSKLVLEANDDYWGIDHEELEGRHKANVQTVEFDIITEAATAVVGLETGSVDICSYVPLSMSEEFVSGQYSDKYNVETIVQGDYWYLGPNALTVDENLRKAVFYAIDSQAVCTAMGGQYVPATSFGNSAYTDYDESLELTGTYVDTYDEEQAKEYLAQSDYNGETLTILVLSTEAATAAAQMIQVQLENIGIKTEINAVTQDNFETIGVVGNSDQWDFLLNSVGGPDMVGSWHLLMDNEVQSGYTTTNIQDDTLQELYNAACADATHDAEHMKECMDYVIDNAYIYCLADVSTALVYTNNIESMYYRESYYTPSSATFVGQ